MADEKNILTEDAAVPDKARVLVVDDEEIMLSMLVEHLRSQGYEVHGCYNGAMAIKLIDQMEFSVLVTDLVMTPIQGQEIVAHQKRRNPDTEVVVMTAYASVDRAVEAIHQHVFDFVEKPFSLRRIDVTIANAVAKYRLAKENRKLVAELANQNERLEDRIRSATRELEELTVKDGLTGLYNYRFYQNIIVAEISRCVRYNRELSLAILDIDFFKIYNDEHGHQAGNEALKVIASILEDSSRESDTVVRYGGEEFVIIFPETDKNEALKVVERSRSRLVEAALKVDSPTGLGLLTISAGVAECPMDASNSEELMHTADMALYEAKRLGRDRAVLANSEKAKEQPEGTGKNA